MNTSHNLDALFAELDIQLARARQRAFRVFHGRGKSFSGLEHLNVEWYPPYLFIQNFGDAFNDHETAACIEFCKQHPGIKGLIEQSRKWPDFDAKMILGGPETLLPFSNWTPLDEHILCETTLGKNRNTGVFLDMRAGWDWVCQHAQDKRVLNLFCYTGVFSLYALRGGANYVDNVDMAANVLKVAQRNHQKNDLHDGQVAFFKRDILKSDRWFEHRPPYDLIIADPPPYQKKAFRGWSDYSKLLITCRKSLNPGGTIFTCLNNPQVTIEEFTDSLQKLFSDAKHITPIKRAEEIKEIDDRKGLKTVAIRF